MINPSVEELPSENATASTSGSYLNSVRQSSASSSSSDPQATSYGIPHEPSMVPKIAAGVCGGLMAVAIIISIILCLRGRRIPSCCHNKFRGPEKTASRDRGKSGILPKLPFTKKSYSISPDLQFDSPTSGVSNFNGKIYIGLDPELGKQNSGPRLLLESPESFRPREVQPALQGQSTEYQYYDSSLQLQRTGQEYNSAEFGAEFDTRSESVLIGTSPSIFQERHDGMSRTTTKSSKYHSSIQSTIYSPGYAPTLVSRTSIDIQIMYDPPPPIPKGPPQIHRKPVPRPISPIDETSESDESTLNNLYSPQPSTALAESDNYSYSQQWIAGSGVWSVPSSPEAYPEVAITQGSRLATGTGRETTGIKGEKTTDELLPPPVPPKERELYLDIPRKAFGSVFSDLTRI